MLESLVQAAGVWFLAAVALQFAAALCEQAGAARSPEDDRPRGRWLTLALAVAALATPALLLGRAYAVTADAEAMTRLWLMGAPLAAMLGGGLVGGVAGVFVQGLAPALRGLGAALALGALALAAYAAWPSLVALNPGWG